RASIINEGIGQERVRAQVEAQRTVTRDRVRSPFGASVWAAASALFLITIGLARLAVPVATVQQPAGSPDAVYVDHTVPLDPVTVDFLEKSELLLRNVMKISPGDADDVADAKKAAGQQLAEIKLRKEAAADVLPVADMMDTYETVLRDLRNVDQRTAPDDIPDIQRRIQRNALIATMKAFQPAVTPVSFGLR